MMKCLVCFLLTGFLSLSGGSTYLFFPRGDFYYKSTDGLPFVRTSVDFYAYRIYDAQETHNPYITSVYDLNEIVRSYKYIGTNKNYSTMYSPLCSLGSLMDCLKQFQVYDKNTNLIGTIEGSFMTSSAAEFTFYDSERNEFAIATIDWSYSEMIVKGVNDEIFYHCSRVLDMDNWFISNCKNPLYFWEIEKISDDSFDERFLWLFMAFVSEVWWY